MYISLETIFFLKRRFENLIRFNKQKNSTKNKREKQTNSTLFICSSILFLNRFKRKYEAKRKKKKRNGNNHGIFKCEMHLTCSLNFH